MEGRVVDGWLVEWVDGRMNGQMKGEVDRWMVGWWNVLVMSLRYPVHNPCELDPSHSLPWPCIPG